MQSQILSHFDPILVAKLSKPLKQPSDPHPGGDPHPDVALPSRIWNDRPGFVKPADRKVADVAFESIDGGPFPLVVVDCGFTQKNDDPIDGHGLLQDAQHWLEQTYGEVKCVLICYIVEEMKRNISKQAPVSENSDEDGNSNDSMDSRDDSTARAHKATSLNFRRNKAPVYRM
ncbi:hypothetical protein EV426DRAFT_710555 [Tirmania nivea]|nr:hypothetical protein EV426DRAFT_710555 [Tirmania nivea]